MTRSGIETRSRIVLDTSAYSHLRRGHDQVIETVARAETVYLPAIVIGELEAGFQMGSRYKANLGSLQSFLEEPYVEILSVDREVSRRYGEVFARLRAAGTPIPINDVWIAASTLCCGASLLTFDSDFKVIEGLPLLHLATQSPTR